MAKSDLTKIDFITKYNTNKQVRIVFRYTTDKFAISYQQVYFILKTKMMMTMITTTTMMIMMMIMMMMMMMIMLLMITMIVIMMMISLIAESIQSIRLTIA